MNKNKKITIMAIPIVAVSITLAFFIVDMPIGTVDVSDNFKPIQEQSHSVPNSITVGSNGAPVSIIAFNDYQCLSCKTWYENQYPEIMKTLIETSKAKIIFLDSPPLGDDSSLMSQATFCANDQQMYSEYQEQLFAKQKEIDTWASSDQLKDIAIELDMHLESFAQCLDSEKYQDMVLSNYDYSNDIGVVKIPLFKIISNDGQEHIFKGGVSSELFEDIVNDFQT